MITIEKEFPKDNIYPVMTLTDSRTPVFFDIETTGLCADTSILYLIGALMIKNDTMIFRQWFANSVTDEADIIKSFFSWLPDNACLIHYNGRGFDVPYISKKCKKLDIPCYLPQITNIDLYRSLAPLKKYFNMDSGRLVAYERLIGHIREDVYNGGELINVYKEFIGKSKFNKEEAEELKNILLLHNEEDILDMVPVLSLYTYLEMFAGRVMDCSLQLTDAKSSASEEAGHIRNLTITVRQSTDFPVEYSKVIPIAPGLEPIRISTAKESTMIIIPVYKARLKHYYEDYKNYYYLPGEDMAVHKNVADCVSRDYRIQATRCTAYTYAEAEFVPQPAKLICPYFQKDIKDDYSFIPLQSIKKRENVISLIKSVFSIYFK